MSSFRTKKQLRAKCSFFFLDVSRRITHAPITTTASVNETTTMTSTEAIEFETNSFEHTNEMIINTTSSSTMEITHQINDVVSNSTFAFQSLTTPSTESNIHEITTTIEQVESTDSTQDNYSNIEQTTTIQPRLFQLLVNSTQYITTEYPITETVSSIINEDSTATTMMTTTSAKSKTTKTIVFH